MSATKETTIWCDSCGSRAQEAYSASLIRKRLKKQGWIKIKNQDYCKECSKRYEKWKEKDIKENAFNYY